MRTRTRLALGTVAAAVTATGLLVGVASAHGWGRGPGPGPMMGPMGGAMLMDQIDTNHDGKITKDELDGFLASGFQRFDKDGDKQLSQEEFAAYLAEVTRPAQVRVFQFFDANGDGKITADELQKPADRFFAMHERDGAIAPFARPHHRPDRPDGSRHQPDGPPPAPPSGG